MLDVLAVALGRLLRFLLRIVRPGGGSALPGVLVSKLAPGLLARSIKSLPQGLVVVSGSAGKSSTTQALVRILQLHGLRVFSNPSTANIRQGYFSAILTQGDWRGRLRYDIAVLEVDEGHGAMLVEDLMPRLAVLTNILSDQLDRFVDPELVIDKLAKIAASAGQVIFNADDPNLRSLGLPGGLSVSLESTTGNESRPKYALRFDNPAFEPSVAHVVGGEDYRVQLRGHTVLSSATSAPHATNDALALLAADQLVELDWKVAESVLVDSKRVFARNEIAEIRNRKVNLRLVQNPTSFQLNLDEIAGDEQPLMLMAGSDIHDPSWLWTVDFSRLKRVDIVGGSNAFDLALRLSYDGVEIGQVEPSPSEAADKFLELVGDSPTILFSADAMRRVRRHLGLAK
jgi:hypothetical protein